MGGTHSHYVRQLDWGNVYRKSSEMLQQTHFIHIKYTKQGSSFQSTTEHFSTMSNKICNDTEKDPYQRRSVVRFQDTLHVVMEGSSANDDYYKDTIDIEATLVRQDTSLCDTSSLMEEMEGVAASSNDDEHDDCNNEEDLNTGATNFNRDDDSSHSTGPPSGDTFTDWISYMYRSYGFITSLMATGGGILSFVISFLCPSNQNNKQIDEDDLVAITSVINGDKAFLFVGGDGGSSFISYVFTWVVTNFLRFHLGGHQRLYYVSMLSFDFISPHFLAYLYRFLFFSFLYTVRYRSIRWLLRHPKMPPHRVLQVCMQVRPLPYPSVHLGSIQDHPPLRLVSQ